MHPPARPLALLGCQPAQVRRLTRVHESRALESFDRIATESVLPAEQAVLDLVRRPLLLELLQRIAHAHRVGVLTTPLGDVAPVRRPDDPLQLFNLAHFFTSSFVGCYLPASRA